MEVAMNDFNANSVPGVLNIQSQKYAINLLWNKVSQGEKPFKVARDAAKIIPTSLICIDYNLCGYQYGLADSALGHKVGMPVLATQIDLSSGSVCGVWNIDDIWLILAVARDGLIIQDKGVKEKDDALLEFNNLVYAEEWDRVICPQEWGVPNSQCIPVSELVKKRKVRKIKSTSAARLFSVSVMCILIVLLFISFYVYNTFYSSREQHMIVSPPMISEKKETNEVEIYMPWSERYLPFQLLVNCKASIEENLLNASSMPGWVWDGHVSCDGKNVKFSIIRQGGAPFWLESVDQFITPHPILTAVDENKAYLSWGVRDVSRYHKQNFTVEKLNSIREIKKWLVQEFTLSSSSIFLEHDIGIDLGGNRVIKCDFSFTTTSDPGIYFPILLKVYGLVVNKVEYTYMSGQWSIYGEFWGVE